MAVVFFSMQRFRGCFYIGKHFICSCNNPHRNFGIGAGICYPESWGIVELQPGILTLNMYEGPCTTMIQARLLPHYRSLNQAN
jgi:hypothetical protein